jgi:hypothetical protein
MYPSVFDFWRWSCYHNKLASFFTSAFAIVLVVKHQQQQLLHADAGRCLRRICSSSAARACNSLKMARTGSNSIVVVVVVQASSSES